MIFTNTIRFWAVVVLGVGLLSWMMPPHEDLQANVAPASDLELPNVELGTDDDDPAPASTVKTPADVTAITLYEHDSTKDSLTDIIIRALALIMKNSCASCFTVPNFSSADFETIAWWILSLLSDLIIWGITIVVICISFLIYVLESNRSLLGLSYLRLMNHLGYEWDIIILDGFDDLDLDDLNYNHQQEATAPAG